VAYDEQLAERIRALTAEDADVAEKPMFGGLAFLVNGNMALAARSGGGVLVRVDPADSAALERAAHVSPMLMRGRPTDGWLTVDEGGVRRAADLATWVERGVSYARGLPPK